MSRIAVFDKEFHLHIPVHATPQGQTLPYVIASGKFIQLTTAYHSLQGDLLEVQAMISYLQSNPGLPPVVMSSMFKAFIIQYAKCFTKAWGRNAKLNADKVYKDHEGLLEIHKEVMEMRNNYIAHAGQSKYNYGAMVIYLNPDLDNPMIVGSIYTEMKYFDHSLKISAYQKLCQWALDYVNNKLEKLGPKFDQELDVLDIKELYRKSKTPDRKDWTIRYDVDSLGIVNRKRNK